MRAALLVLLLAGRALASPTVYRVDPDSGRVDTHPRAAIDSPHCGDAIRDFLIRNAAAIVAVEVADRMALRTESLRSVAARTELHADKQFGFWDWDGGITLAIAVIPADKTLTVSVIKKVGESTCLERWYARFK